MRRLPGNDCDYMENGKINIKEKQFSNSEFIPEIIKLLDEGHTVTLLLRGYSMRPFLEDGRDKALIVKAKNPKVGAPVLAEIEKGHFVLHRIVMKWCCAVTVILMWSIAECLT